MPQKHIEELSLGGTFRPEVDYGCILPFPVSLYNIQEKGIIHRQVFDTATPSNCSFGAQVHLHKVDLLKSVIEPTPCYLTTSRRQLPSDDVRLLL